MAKRYGMVVDLKRCVACHSCALACKMEQGTPPGVFWSKVTTKEEGEYPSARMVVTPMQCMHCQDAPCVSVCPTGATYKREDGIILCDYDKCMGCRYCELSCPYDARVFIHEIKAYQPDGVLTPYEAVAYKKHHVGAVEKCTLCVNRIDKGLEPACVVTCPAYARYFGDLNDKNSEVSKLIAQKHGRQLNAQLGTNPSVYYLGG